MIKPTVGRVVWYHPKDSDPGAQQATEDGFVTHSASVAYVWSDTCVNLAVVDSDGIPYNVTSVLLVQDGQDVPSDGGYAEWMPYQKQKAAKNEALESKLTEKCPGEQAVS